MSTDLKVQIFAYVICAFISLVFTIITVSDYGRKHVQLPWYRLILVSVCLYVVTIVVLIAFTKKIILKL